MDLKKRLAQLDRLTQRPKAESEPPTGVCDDLSSSDYQTTLIGLGLSLKDGVAGEVWVREYEDPNTLPMTRLPNLRGLFTQESDTLQSVEQLLFLDTETTGLAGGTGTIPFLLGLSWVKNDRIHTRQYFLPGPGQEDPILAELAALAESFDAVVSFNGASYDLPLLRNRFLLNRRAYPLAKLVSWDLLVPSRRLWARGLENCRQQTIENDICQLRQRSQDIEGHLIPQTWFDYLANAKPGVLPAVLHHNYLDMLGMVHIFSRVVLMAERLAQTPERPLDLSAVDCWSLGRICENRRETELAIAWMQAAVDSAYANFTDARFVADALRILKRGGNWLQIEKIIQWGLAAGVADAWLHREAAILYEHRLGQLDTALRHAVDCAEHPRIVRLKRRLGLE